MHLVKGRLIPYIRQTHFPNGKAQIAELFDQLNPEIVHDNGLWLKLGHLIAKECEKRSIPRVVSPRGCLDPWALQYRNWKKRIALRLYQQKDLESVTCFHAASEVEAENIRAFGLKQPIAIIPNGVNLPDDEKWKEESIKEKGDTKPISSSQNQPISAFQDFSVSAFDKRTALFVGRLHPIKNLPNLLRAWAKVKPADWQLRIVGSDEVNQRAHLLSLASELGIRDSVSIEDPCYGEAKEALFREAELFFLVSKSENFGISAAEGMAAGLPVIASRSTPWSCIEANQLGWWVEGEPDPLAEAIADATAQSPDALHAIGQRGRAYAAKEFAWPAIAEKMKDTYEEIKN